MVNRMIAATIALLIAVISFAPNEACAKSAGSGGAIGHGAIGLGASRWINRNIGPGLGWSRFSAHPFRARNFALRPSAGCAFDTMIRVGILECLFGQRRRNRAAHDRANENECSHARINAGERPAVRGGAFPGRLHDTVLDGGLVFTVIVSTAAIAFAALAMRPEPSALIWSSNDRIIKRFRLAPLPSNRKRRNCVVACGLADHPHPLLPVNIVPLAPPT
jgi:hypothetical protein